MLWAMFCWKSLGPGIHVDATFTRTTYLKIVADHVHPFMAVVFPDGSGLFQKNNALCHTVKIVQELVWGTWQRVQDVALAFKFPKDLNMIEHLWDMPDQQIWSKYVPPRKFQDCC